VTAEGTRMSLVEEARLRERFFGAKSEVMGDQQMNVAGLTERDMERLKTLADRLGLASRPAAVRFLVRHGLDIAEKGLDEGDNERG
jgi:hypothetical protein